MTKPRVPEETRPAKLRERVKRSAWPAARILLVVWFLCGAILYLAQDWLIFPASPDVFRDPSSEGWPYENVELTVAGETTEAWYLPMDNAPATVLFSHGNAGNLANRIEAIRCFRELGLSVLAYDYGGYGNSTGKTSEARCYADARAAWQWLTEEAGVAPANIVIAGRSLGSAIAARLATEVNAAAVILESTFTSLPDMAWRQYPFYPMRWLVRHRFDTLALMSEIKEPVLIVHSPDDDIVPYDMGQTLFDAANPPKSFLEIVGDHNHGFMAAGAGYTEGLRAFLAQHLPAMNEPAATE